MVDKILTLRSNVPGNRPPAGHSPGELYVNFADAQLGVVNTASANQDLLAVRNFSTTANYAVGAFVLYNGNLYQATAASAAGAFVPANWTQVATAATLAAAYLPLTGGTLSGPGNLTVNGAATFNDGLTLNNVSAANNIYQVISGAAGNDRPIFFETGTSKRWEIVGADGAAEQGAQIGSNFVINRYDDTGTFIDQPFTIQRNTGLIGLNDGAIVPTRPQGDVTQYVANTAFVWTKGMQSAGQKQIPALPFTLNSTYAGYNNLCAGPGTLTMPADGLTYTLNNTSTSPITLQFTGPDSGTDFSGTIYPGQTVTLTGDGGGYYRCVATGLHGNADYHHWTPVLGFGGTGISSYALQDGAYQIVGSFAFFSWRLQIASKGPPGGDAILYGLPFTPVGGVGNAGTGVCPYANMVGLTGLPFFQCTSGQPQLELHMPGATQMTWLTDQNFTDSSALYGSGMCVI